MSASRIQSFKNTVVSAREQVKRYAEHQDLIYKFLVNYEHDGEPDRKHGRRKYKAILQKASNDQLETVEIDLNDVNEFCAKELLNPDSKLAEGLSVTQQQLQKSIQEFIASIETNTLHYEQVFYQACDKELPERDAQIGELHAKELVRKWRTKQAQQQPGAGSGIPLALKNNWQVRFKPLRTAKVLKLREIDANCVGSLVQLDCLVVRTGQVKPKVEIITYHCEVCGCEVFQTVEGDRYTPPRECPSQRCERTKSAGKLRENIRTSKFAKYQEMRVQEMSSHVDVGSVPRSINVVLSGDLTRQVLPGDAITLTGVFTPAPVNYQTVMQKGTLQEMYIDAHHIVKHKKGYNDTTDDADIEEKVEQAARQGNLFENASKSIAPEIFGHADVKKALLLLLVGSYTKQMKDGLKIRGDIHALLMGDPGVAKSQLMKQVCAIAPRSVYTTGKGSSGVGLTATVIRDNKTGEVKLEGGSLVLADKGVCCIDEFDKMEESDRTAIHEVMEQQSISLAKAGITTTLNCRTSILAAANPVYGRYNPYKSPIENIDLPAALLSRFDLIFLLLDTVDVDKDKKLSLHVCKVHANYERPAAEASEKVGFEANPANEDADILNMGFKPYDSSFMRTYIRKARAFEPLIADDLMKDIVDAYVSIRDDEKREGIDSRKSYTTPRTLLAILRLSQAHARARFSPRVERRDFDEAMRLMKASKESIELSAPAKRGQNPLDLVYDIIADLSRRREGADEWVEMAHIVSMAGHKALTREMVMEAIENWESLNVLGSNPEKTLVKFLVPPV